MTFAAWVSVALGLAFFAVTNISTIFIRGAGLIMPTHNLKFKIITPFQSCSPTSGYAAQWHIIFDACTI
jgi:hypothetical protein